MTVIWTGAFSTAPIPVAQRVAGWSNVASGAGTLHTRFRDGDPASAFAWTELYGNLDYYLAEDRSVIWQDVFINGTAGSTPPRHNGGTSWASLDAVYTFIGPISLHANARRGDAHPPQLHARVSAKLDTTNEEANGTVRLYSVRAMNLCYRNWVEYQASAEALDTDSYAEWVLPTNATTWPVAPGWVIPTGDVDGWKTIVKPRCFEQVIEPPNADDVMHTTEWYTYLVLAAIGDGNGTETFVRAIEVWEEEPGA